MNDRLLFLIYNGEIKFLNSNIMDHRDWFKSLGGTDQEYETLIRGFIINNTIIFVKGPNLTYDNEVIDVARKCGPLIKKQLTNPDLNIACGVNPGENGDKWEPIMVIPEENTMTNEQMAMKSSPDALAAGATTDKNIIEFKNNFDDPMFVMYAVRFTLILLIAAVITKILLIALGKISLDSKLMVLMIIVQIVSLALCIRSYSRKDNNYKIFGLIATGSLFFMLDLFDIIIGALNLLFIVDQKYIISFMKLCSDALEKGKQLKKK